MNRMIAIDLNNADKERPTLSLGRWTPIDETKERLTSCIVAYEGRVRKNDAQARGENALEVDEPVIYVADWVSHGGEKNDGIKLIWQWLTVVKETYANSDIKPKLVFEAREQTSLPIIKKAAARAGFEQASAGTTTWGSGEGKREVMTLRWAETDE